jgi:hypothetical protein
MYAVDIATRVESAIGTNGGNFVTIVAAVPEAKKKLQPVRICWTLLLQRAKSP